MPRTSGGHKDRRDNHSATHGQVYSHQVDVSQQRLSDLGNLDLVGGIRVAGNIHVIDEQDTSGP